VTPLVRRFTLRDMEHPVFEFHIARTARDRYRFADRLFALTGNVVVVDLAASRDLAHRMNTVRDVDHYPDRVVHPATLNAMGLLDEVTHLVLARFRERRDPRVMLDALGWLESRIGPDALEATLLAFVDQFPTTAVYHGVQSTHSWLAGETGGIPHRAIALEELITVWLANLNPSFRPFAELFDDDALARGTAYCAIGEALREYFESRPRFGPEDQNLIDMLRAPAMASPDSLEGQLEYIRLRWAELLGDFLRRLLLAMDVLREEQVAIWLRFHPPGPRPSAVVPVVEPVASIPSYAGQDTEAERFSHDEDWMARTVLVAKSTYVWLGQLSRVYGRAITRLDQIPDEELETLARRGFDALWLIGLWERSRASQRIKRLCGNPEAVASAYSLHDYAIAADLGGAAGYEHLRDRARAHGIRLASDMVPNHMGIDSRWVIEHPDRFLSLPASPFPAYRFDGPNLSEDGRVEIKIEDHYYDRSDAAVVFSRLDGGTGEVRFIYHGNDGTSFPWNDTAQLDFTRADVREAVIQTILRVARDFPIIRFDAAMTLAKRHFQRLWFPVPGSGGAIPSRAERGLSRAAFDALMPVEFWREVVDRVAAEAPGTLLLAEAFWLMEGYFVRTLGMHRVYNSAFMIMLRDEDNAQYRLVVKNTLEFDPEILGRYVNFMNNPDERTAVDQFGKGDKYFGVCTLMATMPGLPMFGHGQVDGFSERYGMEYHRAYYDEAPDAGLIARHERQIAPLLRRRQLFASSRDFRLYDFFTDEGWVNEDVFAYSNRRNGERALVVYHNRSMRTRGWLRTSCAYADKGSGGGQRLVQQTLGEALGLSRDATRFVIYRDMVTDREHLHRSCALADEGLRLELEAYTCHVFLDWREIAADGARPWDTLTDRLGGRGVPSVDEAMLMLVLEPMHAAWRAVLDPALVASLAARTATSVDVGERVRAFLAAVHDLARRTTDVTIGELRGDVGSAVRAFERRLDAAMNIVGLEIRFESPWPADVRALFEPRDAAALGALLAWCALEALGRLCDPVNPGGLGARLFDSLRLRGVLAAAEERLGLSGDECWRAAARVRVALAHAPAAAGVGPMPLVQTPVPDWNHDPDAAWLTGINEHQGKRYFVKELFDQLVWWMALPSLIDLAAASPSPQAIRALERDVAASIEAAAVAGYRQPGIVTRPPPCGW
jgi:glycosidase